MEVTALSQGANRIDALPSEVELYLFRFFGPKDLALLSTVSKWFAQLAGDASLWRRLLVLHFPKHPAAALCRRYMFLFSLDDLICY